MRYITSDQSGGNECDHLTGQASQRRYYTLVGATLRFAQEETMKTVQISIVNHRYVEGNEFFFIQLQNPVGAGLGPNIRATITVEDNDVVPTIQATNSYLSNPFLVKTELPGLSGQRC